IHGASATIQSVSAQKSQYVKNDVAEILLSWTPSADSFPGSRKGPTAIEAVYTDISITDMKSGADCIIPIHPLKGQDDGKNNTGGFFTYEPVIVTDCEQPVITVTLSDDQGRTLDQKRVVLEGKSSDTRSFPSNTLAFGIVIGLILLALIIMVYEKMKKNETASLMKSLLFVLAVVSILGITPGNANAQTEVGDSLSVVATVNVSDAKIINTSVNSATVGFDISNKVGVQPDIRYGIDLYKKTKDGKVLYDSHVYDEAIILGEGEKIHREISYPFPLGNGDFEVWVVSANSNAFPFGQKYAGDVFLGNSSQFVELSSCFLFVGEGSAKKTYPLSEDVITSLGEKLTLNCSAKNKFGKSVESFPFLETSYRSLIGLFGERIEQKTAVAKISLDQNEEKNVTIEVLKQTIPQAYSFELFLVDKDGFQISNTVIGHYVVQGRFATIQNITLDKASYKKGDMLQGSILWTGSAEWLQDDSANELPGILAVSPVVAVQMRVTSDDKECIEPNVKAPTVKDTHLNFSERVLVSCENPTIWIQLLD
ncbi:MAG: hypothetical protein NUV53_02920, partial [Patescibacteria group bacterium]|nr:hypothetical protein [Patescibacteria group bacterium]